LVACQYRLYPRPAVAVDLIPSTHPPYSSVVRCITYCSILVLIVWSSQLHVLFPIHLRSGLCRLCLSSPPSAIIRSKISVKYPAALLSLTHLRHPLLSFTTPFLPPKRTCFFVLLLFNTMQSPSFFKRSLSPSKMGNNAPRRLLPIFLIALLVILSTAYFLASLRDAVPSPRELVSTVGGKLSSVAQPHDGNETSVAEEAETNHEIGVDSNGSPTYNYATKATEESEKGMSTAVGKHFHVRPSTATPKQAGFKGCEYPIMIHTTPTKHCTGALSLYASIVRNTLTQPKALKGKTCVHFTFVDPELKTLEDMYEWTPRSNPFPEVEDCARLDSTPEYNKLVPVRWQALPPIEKPDSMDTSHPNWLAALNKVHSWAFDLYPRVLYLDADSFILTDLHKIFLDLATDVDVAAVPDQFSSCHDRDRMNGGMVMFRPSRYLHIVMLELLHDNSTSCLSGRWSQSEQELLNCFCGFNYHDKPVWQPRPEFTCRMMPIYNSVWPRNYGCSDVNVEPIRSIHFTAVTKPWNIPEEKLGDRFDTTFFRCLRDSVRGGKTAGLTNCYVPPLEETRLVDDKVSGPAPAADPASA
jgi:hypothetical protein